MLTYLKNVGNIVKIPCAERLPFIVSGLYFLTPALTNIQFQNLTLIATALVLGAKFNLTEISRMWLKKKSVSALSEFLSDSKFCTNEMMHLYVLQMKAVHNINGGYFLIDDSMKHHSKFCKWIHGSSFIFDHAMNANLNATCIVFLYFTDGVLIKFPICFRIFYQEKSKMPWRRGKNITHKTKYDLAVEMLEWAIKKGFPKCTVLADSWFGIGPFIKELKRLELSYILEVKSSYTVKTKCKEPKLTPKGRLAKNQYEEIPLPKYFNTVLSHIVCGFDADIKTGKKEKVLYNVKIATVRLKSISGKHRIIESVDPVKQSTKYLLTDQLTWEGTKIISDYSHRWVIEEFFRNAKQLTDMEGATIRSEQGVALSLCLVSWIDSLLHFENYKQCTAGKLPKEPLTVPSIVRRAQYDNLLAFVHRVQNEEDFIHKWLEVEKEHIERTRKINYELIQLDEKDREKKAA